MGMPREADLNRLRQALDAILGEVVVTVTGHGVVGVVYRVVRGDETFFARVPERRDDNLLVDAEVHRRLRDAGVRVPEVIHASAADATLHRSILVTRHIGGAPLTSETDAATVHAVVRLAARDVAVINQIDVVGFGPIVRDAPRWPLQGPHRNYESHVDADLPTPWPGAFGLLFSSEDLAEIELLLDGERARELSAGALSHSDLNLDHIYSSRGTYTGIIDLGGMAGCEPARDLGVFWNQSPREIRAELVAAFLAGYREVATVPDDIERRLRTAGTLDALQRLGRWVRRGPPPGRDINELAGLIVRRFLPAVRNTR